MTPQSAPVPSPAMTVTPEPAVPAPTPATETSVPGHAGHPPSVEVLGASSQQAAPVTLIQVCTQVPAPEEVGTGDSVSQAEFPDEAEQVPGNPYWKFLGVLKHISANMLLNCNRRKPMGVCWYESGPRLRRYFRPKADGSLKCSPQALQMWKDPEQSTSAIPDKNCLCESTQRNPRNEGSKSFPDSWF